MKKTKKTKYEYEQVPVKEEMPDGSIVYNLGADLASADPAVYNRLLLAGKLEEAKKMTQTPMYRLKKKKGN